jgi:MarR family transcriptional regulator for hemolysin
MGSSLSEQADLEDDWERTFGFLVHDVARLRKALFDERMKRFGLTRSQWWVIGHLNRRDGVTQSALGRQLEMTKVTLAGLLDRLEEKGWVERRADEHDRRVRRIFLTRELKGLRREMDVAAIQINERCFARVSPEDRRRVIAVLLAMKDNLEAMAKGTCERTDARGSERAF